MINLLPPEAKNNLSFERIKRLVLTLWMFSMFFIFCFSLVLYSLKNYLDIQKNSYVLLLEEAGNRLLSSEFRDLGVKISQASKSLEEILSFYRQKTDFSEILAKLAYLVPKEAVLDGISLSVSETNKGQTEISLTGFASEREVLFSLKRNLEQDRHIQDVYFPPANWVKAKDINFVVSFKVSKNSLENE